MEDDDNQVTHGQVPAGPCPRSESVLDDSQTEIDMQGNLPDAVKNVSDGTTKVMKRQDSVPVKPEEEFEPPDNSLEDSDSVYEEAVSQGELELEEAPTSISQNREAEPGSEPAPQVDFDPEALLASQQVEGNASSTPPPVLPPVPQQPAGPSRLMLILLASYASAITIALLYLLMRGGRQHQLESLPDVIPESAGQITFAPVDAELPPGHRMTLGSEQRFGNIIVEPLRITEEAVNFTHYTGDSSKVREPSAPVLKLWLRFTNASRDQVIVPLDRNLLLRWVIKRDTMKEYTNQYIHDGEMKSIDEVVMLYRLPPSSEWDLSDQQLGLELAPGESFETYIASTDEGLDRLQGQLLWRIQFRKGFSPHGNGVTTLIDVAFKRSDVKNIAG